VPTDTPARLCKGKCGRDLNKIDPPLRRDAETCRSEKCRSAWKRDCTRWRWNPEAHQWESRSHDHDVGLCHCGKYCVPQRSVLEVKRLRGLLKGQLQEDRKPLSSGERPPGYARKWLTLNQRHWLDSFSHRVSDSPLRTVPPGCHVYDRKKRRLTKELTNVGGEEAWKAALYKPHRFGYGPIRTVLRHSGSKWEQVPLRRQTWALYAPRPSVSVDPTPGPSDREIYGRWYVSGIQYSSRPLGREPEEWQYVETPPVGDLPTIKETPAPPPPLTTTIEDRRPDWRETYVRAYMRGELTVNGARTKIRMIEAERGESASHTKPTQPTLAQISEARRDEQVARLKQRTRTERGDPQADFTKAAA
jgi:hypothetical protein